MERQNLQKHVRTLITLPVADAPVISCYQALAAGRLADRNTFDGRVRSLRRGLNVPEQHAFDAALARIEDILATELLPQSKRLAVFSRAGVQPFFLPLQFQVPLPNWSALDSTPKRPRLTHVLRRVHTSDPRGPVSSDFAGPKSPAQPPAKTVD